MEKVIQSDGESLISSISPLSDRQRMAKLNFSEPESLSSAIKAAGKDYKLIKEYASQAAQKHASNEQNVSALNFFTELAEKAMPSAQAYLIHHLPFILSVLSEKKATKEMRTAAETAVKTICDKISPNAFRDILPALIQGADIHHSKWQTRVAALQAFSKFADHSIEQLAFAMPQIIPEVSLSMIDTKEQVGEAALAAMTAVCDVIGNRDLEHMTTHIVRSITHPEEVQEIMHKLAGVTFVQSVESPALAMVTPLLIRGLKSGITATMRQSAVIIGNMAKLVNNPLDAAPFMGSLLPALEHAAETLSDPEARGVAEKTLSQMNKLNVLVEKEKARQKTVELEKVIELVNAKMQIKNTEIFIRHVAQVCCSLMSLRHFEAGQWKEVSDLLSIIDAKKTSQIMESLRKECEEMVEPLPEVDEDADDDAEELCNCTFTLAYGTKILLHNTSLKLKRGAKYGLLGGNDSGKTTLMRSIANGSVEGFPDSSQVRTVFVEADILGELSHLSCVDYVMQDPRLAHLTKEDILPVMASVGFKPDGKAKPDAPVSSLSGGWRMKLALARAMLQRADILLLDEPTNHLDVINVQWVINYINSLNNVTAIMVSHDSKFLDSTCTNIIQIENLKLKQHRGNLAAFIEKNPDVKAYFNLKASKVSFKFPNPGPIDGVKSRSKALMKMTGCYFTWPGNDKPTLHDINIQVSMASRVACVGENGAGKSTMIKVLTGEVVPQVGEVWKHPNARIAYVAQHAFHHIESHLDKTPNEYIRWRYADGFDKESLTKISFVLTDEEKQAQSTAANVTWKDGDGKIRTAKKVINFLTGSRRQPGKDFEYEVVFINETQTVDGIFLDSSTLKKMGWDKEMKAIDTRIAQTSGQAVRTLSSSMVEKHLGELGLEAEFATHYRMSALSGGQKVKVVLAAALWNQPHILILDEPTNYLDRESLGALAKALEDFQGGVVIISHNNEFVSTICKEEWLMDAGHLKTSGESGWMDRQEDKMEEQAAITEMTDAHGNVTVIKTKKKMTKKQEKLYAKEIKRKIDSGIELDDDENDYAIENNIH